MRSCLCAKNASSVNDYACLPKGRLLRIYYVATREAIAHPFGKDHSVGPEANNALVDKSGHVVGQAHIFEYSCNCLTWIGNKKGRLRRWTEIIPSDPDSYQPRSLLQENLRRNWFRFDFTT